MIPTPSHERERDRLAALRRYAVLDSPPEQAFDAIVQLAAQICETPIALITLIDEARQWFKARFGMPFEETPREYAFGVHAIEGNSLCLVPDALHDSRFIDNPLVTDQPNIRFYAGMPIITSDGFPLGTLCVIDRKPRPDLNEHQRDALQLLARETMTQLELRRALKETAETKRGLEDVNYELEAFSAAVAHDLRAPLRHIEAYSRMLIDECGGHPVAFAHAQKVHAACTHAHGIVDALLRLSRAAHSELHIEQVDISSVAFEVAEQLRTCDSKRQVDFVISPHLTARGDPDLLRLVLVNLMSSAWKFTRGRTQGRIEIGSRPSQRGTEFFVRDNGVGFDASRALIPSKPFTRWHSGEQYEGVGLGLTIVERILRRHGGMLRAEGRPDEGATFYFTLAQMH